MRVKDAMHRDAQWRDPSTPVSELAALMKSEDIGAVPIGENDRLVGMVTDRDIAIKAFAEDGDVSAVTAGDVMSEGIVYCMEDEDIEDAIHLMEDKEIRRLPVINEDKRMVGILSLGDVSHAVGQSLSGELVKAVSAHH
ncbi:MAG: CBS domain-containing protein [Pseudomonadota bacterium]